MLYGLKDCANMQVISKADGQRKIYADYARTSSLEFTSESVYAHKKTTRAVRWDTNREGTFQTSFEVFSMDIIAMLFGKELEAGSLPFVKREVLAVTGGAVTLAKAPNANSVQIYKTEAGDKTALVEMIDAAGYTVADKTVTLNETAGLTGGEFVAVFYAVDTPVKSFTVDDVSFPGGYEIIGDTAIRDTDQNDTFVQFKLLNVKPQSNVTLTMSAEDVATIEINWDIMADANGDMMTWAQVEEDEEENA